MFGQAATSWQLTIEKDLTVEDIRNRPFKNKGTELLSNYTDDMLSVIRAYKRTAQMDDNTFYLFLVSNPEDPDRVGYFPLKRNAGFVFADRIPDMIGIYKTIAHELAHGAFRLQHPWEDRGASKTTQYFNLMDYTREGVHLHKYQWDLIHDPVQMLALWQDEDGAVSYFSDAREVMKIIEGLRYSYQTGTTFKYVPIKDYQTGPRAPSMYTWRADRKQFKVLITSTMLKAKTYEFSHDKNQIKIITNSNPFIPEVTINLPLTSAEFVACVVNKSDLEEFLNYIKGDSYPAQVNNTITLIPDFPKNKQLEYLYSLPISHFTKFNIDQRIKLLKNLLPQSLNRDGPNNIDELSIVENLLLSDLLGEELDQYLQKIRDNNLFNLAFAHQEVVGNLLSLYYKNRIDHEDVGKDHLMVWDARSSFSFKYYTSSIDASKVNIFSNSTTVISTMNYFVGGDVGTIRSSKNVAALDPLTCLAVLVIEPSGAMRNQLSAETIQGIPAFYLSYLIQKETEASEDAARNFMITITTAGIGLEGMLAAKGLLYVYRVAQLTIPVLATVISIPSVQQKMREIPGGSEFIAAVNTLNIFVGILSAGELVVAAPEVCKNVINGWKRIKSDPKTKSVLGGKFDEVENGIVKLEEAVGGIATGADDVSNLFASARQSAIAKFGKEAEDLIYVKFNKDGGAAAEILDHYGIDGLNALKKSSTIDEAAKEIVKGKTLYRAVNESTYNFDKLKNQGVIDASPNQYPTYVSLDHYTDANVIQSKLQLPKKPTWVAEFDGNQIINDVKIPNGKYLTAEYKEVLCRSYPEINGVKLEGGGSQFITNSEIKVKRLINLETGEIINFTH